MIRNKGVARRMSKPRDIDYKQLIHFGRYSRGKMRVVNTYAYQKNLTIIAVWSDTDHAGCLETREKPRLEGDYYVGNACE